MEKKMDLPSDWDDEDWRKPDLGINFRAIFSDMEYVVLAKHPDKNFQKEAGIGPFTVGGGLQSCNNWELLVLGPHLQLHSSLMNLGQSWCR